jgi:hypothetical protein
MSACRSCQAIIIWARTFDDTRMPLDAEPCPEGNVRLFGDGRARVLTNDERFAAIECGQRLYRSHFATCPNAKAHRRRRVAR